MNRYAWVALAAALAIGAGVLYALPARTQALCQGCNIILISIDTLGAKHTSVHDPSVDTTPFLARLMNERGVVFERAYAQAPWTLPSHTSMLTGTYPWEVGVEGPYDALPLQLDTLAELLQREGYTTAAFSTGAFVQPQWQFDQGFDEFYGSLTEDAWNDLPTLLHDSRDWALASTEPFFLFIHSFHVHDPYGDPDEGGITISDIVSANTHPGGPSDADAERFRDAYREEIRATDRALEEFFAELETAGLLENTLVIITSDHGEEFGEHGTVGYHSVTVYVENIHVPLLFLVPGTESRRVPYTVEVRSIPATVLEAVGGALPTSGAESLLPLVTGSEQQDRLVLARTINERGASLETIEGAYASLPSVEDGTIVPVERTEAYLGRHASAAVHGPYAVIRSHIGASEAYDLSSDPEQQHNLIDAEVHPSMRQTFDVLLATLRELGR